MNFLKRFGFSGLFFDADTGAGGGSGDGTGGEQDPNAGGNGGKTLTQEEVNAIISERVKRAEEAALKKQFESLGVSNADELKALVEAQRQADEANKTELQKLADKAKIAEDEAKRVKDESETKLADLQKRVLDSEIKILAGQTITDKDGKVVRQQFRPEALDDVIVLIGRKDITEEDGTYKGIDKALDALAKAKPWLLAEETQQRTTKGTPQPDKKPKSQDNAADKTVSKTIVRSL